MDQARRRDQVVGQRGLAVVDVGQDAQVADAVLGEGEGVERRGEGVVSMKEK